MPGEVVFLLKISHVFLFLETALGLWADLWSYAKLHFRFPEGSAHAWVLIMSYHPPWSHLGHLHNKPRNSQKVTISNTQITPPRLQLSEDIVIEQGPKTWIISTSAPSPPCRWVMGQCRELGWVILALVSEPAMLPAQCSLLICREALGKKAITSPQTLCWKSQAASKRCRSLATGLTLKAKMIFRCALGFCPVQEQQGVLSTRQAWATLFPLSWRLPKARLSISSCSLRGPSIVLLIGHTLHQTLLQMQIALWGPLSVALGREGGRGASIFLITAVSQKLQCGSFGGPLGFFVFYNILWYSKVFASQIFFFYLK